MGIWDDLTGKTAAKASNAAAADTYGKQQGAINKLLGYGDDYRADYANLAGGYDPLKSGYDPYAQTGYGANTALQRLIADPSSVRSLPGYQFDMEEGTRALDRGAASRGMLGSGRASKDLLRFGTGLADKTFGDQLARLLSITTGVGLPAQGAQTAIGDKQIGTVGQGITGQLGARTTAYGGDMNSAGTIGQGMVAGANARAQGTQNLFNGIGKLAGSAFGAFGGTPGLSSMMGGGGVADTFNYGGQTFPMFR